MSRPPAAEHWRVYDDGETIRCKDIDGEPYAGGRRYRFVDTDGGAELSLLIEPVGAESAVSDLESAMPYSKVDAAGRTPGEQPSYVLHLAGIALPRIDSPRKVRLSGGIDL